MTAKALQCAVVRHTPELWATIRADWEALVARRGDTSIFLSSPWIETWLEVYGPTLHPDALIWRRNSGETVGACLVTVRAERRGPFTVRRAYVNATGENRVASEHNHILCDAEYADGIAADLVRHARRRNADALVLNGFRADAAAQLTRHWPHGGTHEGFTSEDRYVDLSDLRAKGTPYLAALSRNTREKIKRSIRLYEQEHGPGSVTIAQTKAQALDWLEELVGLHTARWQAQGQPGAFGSPDALTFHRRLVERCAEGDGTAIPAAEIVRVQFGDTVVGLLYNLTFRGSVAFYQSGFQYSEDNRLRPGLVTHALAIQHYLDGNAIEYDFLAGSADTAQYKQSLGPEGRPLVWLEHSAPTAKMRFFHLLRDWRARRRVGAIEREAVPAEP